MQRHKQKIKHDEQIEQLFDALSATRAAKAEHRDTSIGDTILFCSVAISWGMFRNGRKEFLSSDDKKTEYLRLHERRPK